jgi:predicted TIM-barrel fold metal-dependent hydrolase
VEGVDTHAHVFSATAPAVAGARYRPSYAARLAAWRALWRPAGITHGVLVQPSFFGTNNTEMLATIASDPSRLRGVAVVDPIVSDSALARLAAGGVRAIRLNLRGTSDLAEYASTRWDALFTRVHARGWHVELFLEPAALPAIAPAFARNAIPLVLDHFGSLCDNDDDANARVFETAKALAADRPVWCKLSAPYRLGGADTQSVAARWLEVLGPGRLVWGSDWPWTQHERGKDYLRLREALDRWVGAANAPAILWDNAARLYGFA